MLENQHLFKDMYERILLGKRKMQPFHLNCEITKKQICRCAFANLPAAELDKVLYRNGENKGDKRRKVEPVQVGLLPEDIAYDMNLYFQGYPANLQ